LPSSEARPRPAAGRHAALALAVAAWAAAGACSFLPRKVALRYTPSKNLERRVRRTPIVLVPFLDKRPDTVSIGRAPMPGGVGTVRLKPGGDLAAWVRGAVELELEAAGYTIAAAGSDYKVGGSVKAVSCGSDKRGVCSIRVEAWLNMKDGWQLSIRDYQGEGLRPPIFPGEDAYELSMEEALREAVGALRRDVERLVP